MSTKSNREIGTYYGQADNVFPQLNSARFLCVSLSMNKFTNFDGAARQKAIM